jgi:hypothetical protein
MAVRIREAFAQPIFGKRPHDLIYRLTFTNEDGIAADFDLDPGVVEQLSQAMLGAVFQVRAKYPNFCFEHMEEH